MKKSPKLRIIASITAALVFSANILSAADVISVNFANTTDFVTGPAGVEEVGNWNNLTGGNGNAIAIIDSNGNEAATMSFSARWPYTNNGIVVNSPNDALMRSYLDTDNSSHASATITNVPYDTYTVFVYHGGGGDGRQMSVDVNGTVLYSFDEAGLGYQGRWMEDQHVTLEDAVAGSGGNVMRFDGVTGSTLTIVTTPEGSGVIRGPLNGFQIVDTTVIPEPSTYAAILGLAGFVMVLIVRRRK